jgi:hypothetical protein
MKKRLADNFPLVLEVIVIVINAFEVSLLCEGKTGNYIVGLSRLLSFCNRRAVI